MATSPAPSQSAGVRIDPQLIYLIPLIVGLPIGRWRPLPIVPAWLGTPLGVALIVLGIAVLAAAVRLFKSGRTSIQPWEPSTALLTSGLYRFSRNPIYLGYTLLYLGAACWLNSAWPFLLLPVVFGAMHRLVIAREERYLESRFGSEYLAFKRRVRRWL